MLALLRHRRVVDHQHRVTAANELIRLDEKLCLQRSRIPDASSDEVMQPVITARRKTLSHWLNALAVTWPDQPRHIKRTHPLPRFVAQAFQERLERTAKLTFPIRPCALHGRPLHKPTTHESLKNRFGNPSRRKNCQRSTSSCSQFTMREVLCSRVSSVTSK